MNWRKRNEGEKIKMTKQSEADTYPQEWLVRDYQNRNSNLLSKTENKTKTGG